MRAPLGIHVPTDHPMAGRPEVRWHELAAWPIVTMGPGTVLHQLLREHLPDADAVVEAMSARTVETMVAQGAGIGLLARFKGHSPAPDLAWIPLAETDPVEVCVVQRTDSQPSRSAVIVRRLIDERAAELG